MARTPLLRALQRLARDHHEADALGIAPAELRERRAEGAMTRRELVKRGGLAGAALVLGPAALAGPARAAIGWNRSRIAIVGGGIAGLSAALRLQDKGIGATVYEASDRIGGRMHSDRSGYFSNGQVAEFCGELIDTGHTTIQALAKRFHLPLTDLTAAQPKGTTDTYWFLNGYYPVSQADDDFAAISDALTADADAADYPTLYNSYTKAGKALDHLSVYDWIESRVPGGHSSRFGRLLDAAYTEEYGSDTTDQASLNLIYLLAYQPDDATDFSIFGQSDERFHIAGGNEQLPEAIADTLPDVRTGWRMTSVAANRDGSVSLRFATGTGTTTVTADQVVLSIPFSVLRTLDYSRAGFDGLKQKAITQLGAGRNTKLQLQFKDRYWNGRGPWGRSTGSAYTDIGIQNTWESTRGQPGATGILNDYSGGTVAGAYNPSTPYSNAAANPQVTAYATAFLAQLETVYPGITKHWNGKATLSTPFRDPNLLLSYSYWRVGQYTGFSGYEAAPQGAIHFAGEHCSTDFQGYMEGGAAEGIRAANEVLAAL